MAQYKSDTTPMEREFFPPNAGDIQTFVGGLGYMFFSFPPEWGDEFPEAICAQLEREVGPSRWQKHGEEHLLYTNSREAESSVTLRERQQDALRKVADRFRK